MKTARTVIHDTVYIFAETKSQYALDNLDPGELPFTYKVQSYDLGDENRVRICEQEVSITIPDGIDITLECIKNLQERIETVEKDAAKKVANLKERIKNLALIEYKPAEVNADG